MNYKHTQVGYIIVVAFAAASLIFVKTEFNLYSAILMGIILFVLASFSTLQTTVDENLLKIKFGYGIFQKKFPIKEIESVKTAKNHWYYGWGIRFWLWPRMHIYNVSGFDAVEIKMKNCKIYRIGTDEPEKLKDAIMESIKSATCKFP